ncbi:hypothetical protein M4R22_13015 [Acidovorax sp. GBBC 3334]|uniref:hypothetical protein n=1 Tax=Acidovorax sp. GBBC 3334 TaxID=2940496 RepID=UPI002304C992|nr:hypothetical protein [Acidovorax sp. GBBC 3334]MDA8455686.1 hypothetical protein [Acidovorax sp. GBBC 3334]
MATPSRRSSFLARCWFGVLCALLGLAPLLLLLVYWPMATLLDCAGNEGSGIHCAGAPWLSDAAYSMFLMGAWGSFFTLPTALTLYLAGAGLRWLLHRPASPR